jgi:hypothetical protein
MYCDDPEYEYIPIPDQDVSHLFQEDPELGWVIKEAYYPDDIVPYAIDGRLLSIDRDTGQKINSEIHPLAGLEEQIGIIRADLATLHVKVGVAPTDEFAKLNAIAAEKIQEGQKKKEALNAENS